MQRLLAKCSGFAFENGVCRGKSLSFHHFKIYLRLHSNCTYIGNGYRSILQVEATGAGREAIMSILFVLLTFLLVITITYFRRRPEPQPAVQPCPDLWADGGSEDEFGVRF